MENHNSKIQSVFKSIFGDLFDVDFYIRISFQEISEGYLKTQLKSISLANIQAQKVIYDSIESVVVCIDVESYQRDNFGDLISSVCPNLHMTVNSMCINNFNIILKNLHSIDSINELSEEKMHKYYNERFKDTNDISVFASFPMKKDTLELIKKIKDDPDMEDDLKSAFDQLFIVYKRLIEKQFIDGSITSELLFALV